MSAAPSRSAAHPVRTQIVNPVMERLVRAGLLTSAYALLETTGRRTGQARVTPVGNGLSGDTFWLVAEGGTAAGYVRNLVAHPRVRVRVGRRWRAGTATVLPDDDGAARRRSIDRANGLLGRLDGRAFERNATDPTTIRIDLDPGGPR